MSFRRIPELDDERMPIERLLNDAALNATAAAVNETDFAESRIVRRVHVLFNDRLDVARIEGMEVDGAFNRDAFGHVDVKANAKSQIPNPKPQISSSKFQIPRPRVRSDDYLRASDFLVGTTL